MEEINNMKDYAEFASRFKEFMEEEGITNLNHIDDEPHYSNFPCDCCQRLLAGNRYGAAGYNPETKEVQEYNICPDCLYFATYGRLDDETMLRVMDSIDPDEPMQQVTEQIDPSDWSMKAKLRMLRLQERNGANINLAQIRHMYQVTHGKEMPGDMPFVEAVRILCEHWSDKVLWDILQDM